MLWKALAKRTSTLCSRKITTSRFTMVSWLRRPAQRQVKHVQDLFLKFIHGLFDPETGVLACLLLDIIIYLVWPKGRAQRLWQILHYCFPLLHHHSMLEVLLNKLLIISPAFHVFFVFYRWLIGPILMTSIHLAIPHNLLVFLFPLALQM